MTKKETEIRNVNKGYMFGLATPLEFAQVIFKKINSLSKESKDPKWKSINQGYQLGLATQMKERKQELELTKLKSRTKTKSRTR